MNLKLIHWLLKHRDVLIQVISLAKKFDRDGSYISQWEVVDEIARVVIPVFEKEGTDVHGLTSQEYDWDADTVGAFALGAEVSALGVDWQALVQVVIPILIAILKALAGDE